MKGTIQMTSRRLLLRRVDIKDADILYKELGCNPAITRYTGWNPYASPALARKKVEQDIARYSEEGTYAWLIQYKEEAVGTIGAYGYNSDLSSIEIGYSIFQRFWGNGFASEAADEVVRYLIQDEGMHRVHAWAHVENAASVRVLLHAGLKQEGRLRQAMKNPDGSYADQLIFGIVEKEYSAERKAESSESFL